MILSYVTYKQQGHCRSVDNLISATYTNTEANDANSTLPSNLSLTFSSTSLTQNKALLCCTRRGVHKLLLQTVRLLSPLTEWIKHKPKAKGGFIPHTCSMIQRKKSTKRRISKSHPHKVQTTA